MKYLTLALILTACNIDAQPEADAGDTDTGTETSSSTDTDTDTGTGEPTNCTATALALYEEGCYLTCEGIEEGEPTECWWTTEAAGADEVLTPAELVDACIHWGAECSYHLDLMIECWEEAEDCPEDCDGDDPNGVTLWDCLE